MANYYYVKNGGTATADAGRVATTPRTTSFATMGVSTYYDSIYGVFGGGVPTTAPAVGDIICVSHLHDKSHTAITLANITNGVLLASVDDTASDAYLKGAAEYTTGIYVFRLPVATSNIKFKSVGITYKSGDDLRVGNATGQRITYEDCEIGLTGTNSSDEISSVQDGSVVIFNNVDISFGNTGQSIELAQVYLEWNGGTLLSSIVYLFETAGNNSPGALIRDVDLTNVTSAVSTLLSSPNNDLARIKCERVLLATGTVLDDTATPTALNVIVEGESIGIGTGGDDYSAFFKYVYEGKVAIDTDTYRTLGSVDKAGTTFSVALVGNSNTSESAPIKYELANFAIDTAYFTTDVTFETNFVLENASSAVTALKDIHCYMEIECVDGADNALGLLISTKPDPLASGTTHTTTTGEWTAGTNNVQMKDSITVTIGTTTGTIASGAVRVNFYLTTDVNAIQAGDLLFACRKVDVS